jgi:hypothetical protein
MDRQLQNDATADRCSLAANPCAILSGLAAFAGAPLMIALSAVRGGSDGLLYLLVGAPASIGVGVLFGLLSCLREEPTGPRIAR